VAHVFERAKYWLTTRLSTTDTSRISDNESVRDSDGSTCNPIIEWQQYARCALGQTKSGVDHIVFVAHAAVAAPPLPRSVRSSMPSCSLPSPPITFCLRPFRITPRCLLLQSSVVSEKGVGGGDVTSLLYYWRRGGGDLQGKGGFGCGCGWDWVHARDWKGAYIADLQNMAVAEWLQSINSARGPMERLEGMWVPYTVSSCSSLLWKRTSGS